MAERSNLKLIQGTLDLLILKTLTRGPQHGYGVSAWIREQTGGDLGIEDASLYQCLHRLERRRLIESEWGPSDNNRRAKYYELTPAGRRALGDESRSWQDYVQMVEAILRTT